MRQSRKEALGNAERVKRAGEFKEIGNVSSTASSCLKFQKKATFFGCFGDFSWGWVILPHDLGGS